jgi:DNA repair protein RadC
MLDCARLAESIHVFTGIPQKRLISFMAENSAEELSSSSALVCATDSQRKKFAMLIEFSRLFATVKSAKRSRRYKLDAPTVAAEYFKALFADMRDRERIIVAYLDPHHRVIRTKIISVGDSKSSIVPQGEIAKEALFCNATSVILAHNHPGGGKEPSSSDIEATQRLAEIMKLFNLALVDHIIIADDKTISLAEYGYITN